MKKNEAAMISRLISEFLTVYAPNYLTVSENTLKQYENTITVYLRFLETQKVTSDQLNRRCFERSKIECWIMWLKSERNCSSDTCNVRLGSLRTFLKYIGSRDITLLYLYNEAKEIKKQKTIKKKVAGLTRDAVSAVLREPNTATSTGRRDFMFLTLLYATAARLNEILSIKICHLHVEAQKPYITLYGKGEKIRTAYLLPRVVTHLKNYVKEFHGEQLDMNSYLFYSRSGGSHEKLTEAAIDKRMKTYAKMSHEKCPDVPLNLHAHQFRHAKATHWLEDGMNIAQISFLLGHEKLETTMKYIDISTQEALNAIETLETEEEKAAIKKWKSNAISSVETDLVQFCGIRR